jgi:replicative DNA helicase
MQSYSKQKKSFSQTSTFIPEEAPTAVEIEKRILGTLLFYGKKIPEITGILEVDDFSKPAHASIYEAILFLLEKFPKIDDLLVIDELKTKGNLESVGGETFILSLQENCFSTGSIIEHIQVVRQKAKTRSLMMLFAEGYSICKTNDDVRIDSVIQEISEKMLQIATNRKISSNTNAYDLMVETIDELMAPSRSIPSPYAPLDAYTDGFQNGDLIILAARPSVGKTTFALDIFKHAVEDKKKSLFFTLEVKQRRIGRKYISNETQIDTTLMRGKKLSEEQRQMVCSAGYKIGEECKEYLFTNDKVRNINDICANARLQKIKTGLDFIIIDYLQKIRYDSKHQMTTVEKIAAISGTLKELALELDVPIILLSQLNRGATLRADKTPLTEDLKGSSDIEQDADIILFLHRDKEEPEITKLIIEKQRDGQRGAIIDFQFETTTGRFIPYDYKDE